jgi:hypothetical protein
VVRGFSSSVRVFVVKIYFYAFILAACREFKVSNPQAGGTGQHERKKLSKHKFVSVREVEPKVRHGSIIPLSFAHRLVQSGCT